MHDLFAGYVLGFAQLRASGAALDAAVAVRPMLPKPAADAPVCLVFSPHPDDEAISGALPYRLRCESAWRVVNVAVTLGSNIARRGARWKELRNCCEFLGFELQSASGESAHGLERISPHTITDDPVHWEACVARVAALIMQHQPRLIVCPHDDDGHPAHIGTHLLVMQALQRLGPDFATHVALSEYWNTQSTPRLMVELGVAEVSTLMGALSQHVGEVERNPYHLGLPAWFMDGVRRGAERVGAPGSEAPDFNFAALYGGLRWRAGAAVPASPCMWPLGAPPDGLFR